MNELSRRHALRQGALAVGALLAGCIGGDETTASGPEGDSGSTPATDSTPTSERSTPTPTPGETDNDETVTETETPLQDGVGWRFDTNAAIEVAPAVADGTVYVGGWRETEGTPTPGGEDGAAHPSTALRALSLDDGSEQWRTDLGAPLQRAPRVVDDTVYAVRGYNGLHGKDYQVRGVSTDGTDLWSHGTQPLKFLTVLGADESGFYVGTQDDNLGRSNEQVTAIAPDGRVRWDEEMGDVRNGTLGERTLYATDYVGTLQAFDKESGTVRWSADPKQGLLREPVVVGDVVVTAGENVVGFDQSDGTVAWERAESSPVSLLGDDSRVYASMEDGTAVGFEADDGSETWSIDTGSELPAIALGDTTVYIVNEDGRLSAHDQATGDRHWETDLGGRAGAVSAGDRVYALSRDRVVALDANDGAQLGSVDVADEPVSLVPGAGADVLATAEGTVYGLSF